MHLFSAQESCDSLYPFQFDYFLRSIGLYLILSKSSLQVKLIVWTCFCNRFVYCASLTVVVNTEWEDCAAGLNKIPSVKIHKEK